MLEGTVMVPGGVFQSPLVIVLKVPEVVCSCSVGLVARPVGQQASVLAQLHLVQVGVSLLLLVLAALPVVRLRCAVVRLQPEVVVQ
jgi:hypothetical protein